MALNSALQAFRQIRDAAKQTLVNRMTAQGLTLDDDVIFSMMDIKGVHFQSETMNYLVSWREFGNYN